MPESLIDHTAGRWLVCPNDPPCPHLGLLHDIESFDEPLPRCCAEGCDCGRPVTLADLDNVVDEVLADA